MPSSRACSSVATEVATQRRSFSPRVGERGQQVGDGRAGAQAHPHPVGDELRGRLGGELLLGVEVWLGHVREHTSRRIVADGSHSRAADGHRRALHQHDPDALDGRDPEGELRAPGHADGARPARLRALAALPALRPRGPDLAQPRPLRALGGPRLDAALLAALPGRREGGRSRLRGRRRARGQPRRHQELPPARLQVPRAPRVPLDLRRRDDHRPARARASRPASGWRSPRSGRPRTSTARTPSSSTSTSTRSPATAA